MMKRSLLIHRIPKIKIKNVILEREEKHKKIKHAKNNQKKKQQKHYLEFLFKIKLKQMHNN